MLHIIKMGGNLIEDEFLLDIFFKNFNTFYGYKILIHGGGTYANSLLKKLGFYTKIIEGRRITNTKTLEVLILSYAGLLNKHIVASLQPLNNRFIALGLSGVDGNLICSFSRSIRYIDYGHVGDFTKKSINIKYLYLLIQLNYIPVLCALTYNTEGNLFNTNADTIASYLAVSMSEIEEIFLHFCFEKKGVLKYIEYVNSYFLKISFSKSKSFRDGLLPKLDNAFYSLKKGVKKVSILHPFFLKRVKNKTILFL